MVPYYKCLESLRETKINPYNQLYSVKVPSFLHNPTVELQKYFPPNFGSDFNFG